mgnify:CR=1 FL=1
MFMYNPDPEFGDGIRLLVKDIISFFKKKKKFVAPVIAPVIPKKLLYKNRVIVRNKNRRKKDK